MCAISSLNDAFIVLPLLWHFFSWYCFEWMSLLFHMSVVFRSWSEYWREKPVYMWEVYERYLPCYELIMFVPSLDMRKCWLRWPWEWLTMYCLNVKFILTQKTRCSLQFKYLHRKVWSCNSFCMKPRSNLSSLLRNQKNW